MPWPLSPLTFGEHLAGLKVLCRIQKLWVLTVYSYGGREAQLAARAKGEAKAVGAEGKSIGGDAKAGAQDIITQAKQKAGQLTDKISK